MTPISLPLQGTFALVFFFRNRFSLYRFSAVPGQGVPFDPMLTSASACLWVLLFWLVASDSKLPWSSSTRKPSSAKKESDVQSRMKAKADTLSQYARIAAYIALGALFWSWSSQHPPLDHDTRPISVADPSAVRVDTARLPSEGDAPEASIESPPQETPDEVFNKAIRNETLGFSKIFVVNLPERTDKRDALSLVGALTNIKLTWTSAIRGTSVPDKALPLGVDRAGWRDGGIGSWRSQINIIRT